MSGFFVSVVIPVYNGEKFLAEAVESVRRQDHHPLEILIVDDGSTDGTAEIAANLGGDVKCLRQANSGPASARNRGLDIAQGDLIAFLDADDLWPDDKLKTQIDCFVRRPNLEVVMGRVQYMLLTEKSGGQEFKEFALPSVGVNLGAGLYKRSVFEKAGRFDPALRQSEDVDLFMRIRELGIEMAVIDSTTLYYRIHENNMTREADKQKALFIHALKRSIDRRRARGTDESLPDLQYTD
jgi:glycosyltransferase involved in cell wall biosynthesis